MDNERVSARLVASTGIGLNEDAAPSEINVNSIKAVWPLKLVANSGKAELMEDLAVRFPNLV